MEQSLTEHRPALGQALGYVLGTHSPGATQARSLPSLRSSRGSNILHTYIYKCGKAVKQAPRALRASGQKAWLAVGGSGKDSQR